jgi:diacylglycerol kinase (ATP)
MTPRRPDLTRATSFRFAFSGWWYALRTQPNAQIHAVITLGALALGAWLGLSLVEWAVIVLTIGMVWAAELFNTALEVLVDLASPDLHPLAKIAKDVSAAAVLVTALMAVVIGLLLFAPPLWFRLVR